MITMTEDQIRQFKGVDVRNHMAQIKEIIGGLEPSKIVSSIHPVVTRCKPNDPNLDLFYLKKLMADHFQKQVGL